MGTNGKSILKNLEDNCSNVASVCKVQVELPMHKKKMMQRNENQKS
jgi:hypothetical protein